MSRLHQKKGEDWRWAFLDQTMRGASLAIPDAFHHPFRQFMRRVILEGKISNRAELLHVFESFYYGWQARELQAKAESVQKMNHAKVIDG